MLLRDDYSVTLMLMVGLFFPTSIGGRARLFLVLGAFVVLLGVVLSLAWKHGTRPGALLRVSLPIMGVLTVCTFLGLNIPFGWGVFASYGMLALVLALNLRGVRAGRAASCAFFVCNLAWIICGVAILMGSEAVATFLTSWYSQFYPELVPGMVALHKPIFTFGTHSLAGFYTYLFFWVNWESYRWQGRTWSLIFAVSELMLLIAITSFTSVALAVLALAQIGLWVWSRDRRVLVASVVCLALTLALTWGAVAEQVSIYLGGPELTSYILNPDVGGFVVRYGPGGSVREIFDQMWHHPLRLIGFGNSPLEYLVDSGPVEFLLRGSVPLLVVVYVGLFRFLRHNSFNRSYALAFFVLFLGFEVGFSALTYFRTLFLLPFLSIYLNGIGWPRGAAVA